MAGNGKVEEMGTLTFEPLGEVGAAVIGAHVATLVHGEGVPTAVLEALEAYGVLVFDGLSIDDESQVAFSKRLGRVEIFGRGELPEIFRVSLDPKKNPAANYLRGTFDWHIDGCTEDVPIMATILSAHAVAESGGETEFASSYAAFDCLSKDEKARVLELRVVHTFEAAQRLVNNDPSPEELAAWRKKPPKIHPLVWTHQSGRRSLVIGATADYIEGMDIGEGKRLLAELLTRSTAPAMVYRHGWNLGDMVIWDNRGVLHRALPYDPRSARDMHRTTLHGEESIQ